MNEWIFVYCGRSTLRRGPRGLGRLYLHTFTISISVFVSDSKLWQRLITTVWEHGRQSHLSATPASSECRHLIPCFKGVIATCGTCHAWRHTDHVTQRGMIRQIRDPHGGRMPRPPTVTIGRVNKLNNISMFLDFRRPLHFTSIRLPC